MCRWRTYTCTCMPVRTRGVAMYASAKDPHASNSGGGAFDGLRVGPCDIRHGPALRIRLNLRSLPTGFDTLARNRDGFIILVQDDVNRAKDETAPARKSTMFNHA